MKVSQIVHGNSNVCTSIYAEKPCEMNEMHAKLQHVSQPHNIESCEVGLKWTLKKEKNKDIQALAYYCRY